MTDRTWFVRFVHVMDRFMIMNMLCFAVPRYKNSGF